MKHDYDMMVIGGGSAGLVAAGMSALLGAKTLLVERQRLGADCTWYGCVPSKALIKAAKVAHEMLNADRYGLTPCTPEHDFGLVMQHVRAMRQKIYEQADAPSHFERMGAEVMQADARFLDPHTVELTKPGGAEQKITSRYFVIATGSRPIQPEFAVPTLSNETIFELTTQPRRLIVLGAGPVGIEMAQAFQRLGSAVTVVAPGSSITFAALSAWSADIDHSSWDALLKRYVNQQHLVDYASWKSGGVVALDEYLARLAAPWPQDLSPATRTAALLNAYNSLTIRWIISNYPVASVWRTQHPFTEARHRIDNRTVSLDAIETELRNMGDPRIHAALVCAARSCPPLRREAYGAGNLDAQLDANVSEWLAMPDRNRFVPEKSRASVSMIFKWYKGDFEKNGGSVESFLAKHAPSAQFLLTGKATLKYEPYHWGLNDTSDLGKDYSSTKMYWDALRNKD